MEIEHLTPYTKSELEVVATLAENKFRLTLNGAELLLIAQLLLAVRGPETSYARFAPDANDCLRPLLPFWSAGKMPIMIEPPKDGIPARGIPGAL